MVAASISAAGRLGCSPHSKLCTWGNVEWPFRNFWEAEQVHLSTSHAEHNGKKPSSWRDERDFQRLKYFPHHVLDRYRENQGQGHSPYSGP